MARVRNQGGPKAFSTGTRGHPFPGLAAIHARNPNWDACLLRAMLRDSRATMTALYAATDFAVSQHTSEQRLVMRECMFTHPAATATHTRYDNRDFVSAAITDFA